MRRRDPWTRGRLWPFEACIRWSASKTPSPSSRTTRAPLKGLAALSPVWDGGPNAAISTAQFIREFDEALDRPGIDVKTVGDWRAAEAAAKNVFTAVYRLPMLAHLAMVPLNCTVHVRKESCDVWVGTQVADRARKIAAAAAGMPESNVRLHNAYLGGGFGRRLDAEYVAPAVKIAKQIDGPVKVIWSREDDVRHDAYRFHNHSRVTVALDERGMPTSWRHKLVGPGVMFRFLPAFTKDGVDLDIVDSAAGPYAFANENIEWVRREAPDGLLTGNWRGVGATRNGVIVEGVIDDLAYRAHRDPVEYRRELLSQAPRALNVLNIAVKNAGWGRRLPERRGLGVAVISSVGSYFAQVAEVSVTPDGHVRAHRVTCAIDCGYVANPDTVKAQIEGAIIFGLSGVPYGDTTVVGGRARDELRPAFGDSDEPSASDRRRDCFEYRRARRRRRAGDISDRARNR